MVRLGKVLNKVFKSKSTNSSSNGNEENQSTQSEDSSNSEDAFPDEAFESLEKTVYQERWSIPYKREEDLGRCLISATKLVLAGKSNLSKNCCLFMEEFIPHAFYKLQFSEHVKSWGPEIQLGVLDMTELLIDLIAGRLCSTPVPVKLLETLSILFDAESNFHVKNRSKPYDRSLYDKQLGDRVLSNPSPSSSFNVYNRHDSYGWLCQIINRFVLKDGINNLKQQFQNEKNFTATEFNALLIPFSNCLDFIYLEKYRQIFGEHVEQALKYLSTLNKENLKAKSANAIFDLISTIRKISNSVWTNRIAELDKLYLEKLLDMIESSNFNAKMNALKELSKLIDNISNPSASGKISIRRENLSQWIIDNSILSKALEGNIDQNQYAEKVRILIDFISSKITKNDIKTIWKMQHGKSSVAVDHLFALLSTAAVRFSIDQLNQLIDFVYESWKVEPVLMQEKLIELLSTIGRDCSKEGVVRLLTVLWNIAHEERLSRTMLDHILRCHLRIFNEARSYPSTLKRDYSLKALEDLRGKQNWSIPAIRFIFDLLSNNQSKRDDPELIRLLVSKNEIIQLLIENLSICQKEVLKKNQGNFTVETLVDGRFNHQESVQIHLNLISFLIKRSPTYISNSSCEKLWDTLIDNRYASSFDQEQGLDWFITCFDDISSECQNALFKKRVSKLNPIEMTSKGYQCFKSYFEKCNIDRRSPIKSLVASSSNSYLLEYDGMNELWNIILCVDNENIAEDATKFLLDYYYSKQVLMIRPQMISSLHDYFLKAVYARLSGLLRNAIEPVDDYSTTKFGNNYETLRETGAQFFPDFQNSFSEKVDHQLWLKQIERILRIIENYINLVERQNSLWAHRASFHGLEYSIKLVHNEPGKSFSSYDIVVVPSNATLGELRRCLADFYQILTNDLHLSVDSHFQLPTVFTSKTSADRTNQNCSSTNIGNLLSPGHNSKHLYELQLGPDSIIYVKIINSSSSQNKIKINSSYSKIYLKNLTPSNSFVGNSTSNDQNSTPSNILASNSKFYEVLYKLMFVRNEKIDKRIRNLLYLLRSDSRINEVFDQISLNSLSKLEKGKQIEQSFDIDKLTFTKIIYNLEILSGKLLPLSSNNGILESSKLFSQHFLENLGVDFLLDFLRKLTKSIPNDYQYGICQEIILFILKLIDLFLRGSSNDQKDFQHENSILKDFNAKQFESFIKQICFLCWAAAAGNLRLDGPKLDYNNENQVQRKQFSRMNSDINEQNHLHFGICIKSPNVSALDCQIASKIIDLMIFCFERRPKFVASFLNEPFFADFLLEILIGTYSKEIRQSAQKYIVRLCTIADVRATINSIVINTQLPLWVNTSKALKETHKQLILHSTEYFELRCYLTENLNQDQQKLLKINARHLLQEELNFLMNFLVDWNSKENQRIDNILILGNLKFVRTLLTCQDVERTKFGSKLIPLLIDHYLFPASRKMLQLTKNDNDCKFDFELEPKCFTKQSRVAAYNVLVELARYSDENLKLIVGELIDLHHRTSLTQKNDWEFMPQATPRASCGFVGLANGGATCYMNSILQQLFMVPKISEYILSVNVDDDRSIKTSNNNNDGENLFSEVQQVFVHLLESKMQDYTPETFWNVFRLWGREINVREQQDAFDFFTSIVDQVDEYLKSIKKEEIFRKHFEGIFSNQMICINGCEHRYEREERFMALNVAVKVHSLEESLNQFVKGEVLDGSDAYFCEKCKEKRTTIKRLCVKKLPPLLCIQMKRFGFDWENNRALKFDDFVRFPLVLNMEPYTVEAVNRSEKSNETTKISGERNQTAIDYELIGIVIHSGQANAGHYYSLIKDVRTEKSTNFNKWFRFNDTTVDEIELDQEMLEEECFGGNYRVEKDGLNEERTRVWSAYILIYRCIQPSKLFPAPAPPRTSVRESRRPVRHNDSLSQLVELVDQTEQNNLFSLNNTLIPTRVRNMVKQENLEFMKNRDTYSESYFQFILKLSQTCFDLNSSSNERSNSFDLCTKLVLHFLFSTHLRTHRRLRVSPSIQSWTELLSKFLFENSTSCSIFYRFLNDENQQIFRSFFFDCPVDDVRQAMEISCENLFKATFQHSNKKIFKSMENFIEQILNLLEKTVVEQIKSCQFYFKLILSFLEMDPSNYERLLNLDLFQRLINFLLGENLDNRRWNSNQAKDFAFLHEILSMLILRSGNDPTLLQHGKKIQSFFESNNVDRYLREVSYAFQEILDSSLTSTIDLMEKLSTNNISFSEKLIYSIVQTDNNDFRGSFKLIERILLINDQFQNLRLQIIFEGKNKVENETTDRSFNGLFYLNRLNIENDQRRAYQFVKFLIKLSKKDVVFQKYFSSTAVQWESAINWLKQQMQTYSQWSSPINLSNENSETKVFQRTRSAQFTLEQAQNLLQQTGLSVNSVQNGNSLNSSIELDSNQKSTLV